MNEELAEFLRRNRACAGGIRRLENLGAETLEDACKLAAPADLVWAVTRPGVMSPEQRRQFLVFVLESIEDNLTDPRSKNILEKLRTKSPITEADAAAAEAAARASDAAWAAADADAALALAAEAAWAAAYAEAADAYAAASAAARAAAALAAADAADADAADVSAEEAAADAAEAAWAALEQQARWIRDNFKLDDLHTN